MRCLYRWRIKKNNVVEPCNSQVLGKVNLGQVPTCLGTKGAQTEIRITKILLVGVRFRGTLWAAEWSSGILECRRTTHVLGRRADRARHYWQD